MGKVKIKRKSTLIDMTAMSDVTVLLLTFFMLTSTFLQKEPTIVMTPSSVSEEKVPMNDFVTVLVSSADKSGKLQDPTVTEGKLFLSFTGGADTTVSAASPAVRLMMLDEAVSIYNDVHPSNKISLTPEQRAKFSTLNMVGVRFAFLPQFLSLSDTERDKVQGDLTNPNVGIAMERVNTDPENVKAYNEFQIWCKAIRNVAADLKDRQGEKVIEMLDKKKISEEQAAQLTNLAEAIQKGEGIGVKADKDTPFFVVQQVFDNLQTMNLNKFSLMTALKSEEEK